MPFFGWVSLFLCFVYSLFSLNSLSFQFCSVMEAKLLKASSSPALLPSSHVSEFSKTRCCLVPKTRYIDEKTGSFYSSKIFFLYRVCVCVLIFFGLTLLNSCNSTFNCCWVSFIFIWFSLFQVLMCFCLCRWKLGFYWFYCL